MYCRSKYKSLRKFGSSDEANSETNMVMTGYHDTVMSCDETMITSCHDYSSLIQPNPEFCPLLEMLGWVKITLSNPPSPPWESILMTNIHWNVMLIWFLSGLSLALNKEGCDWKDRHSARANSGRATHLSQTRYTPLVEVNQAIKAWSF